MEVFLVMRRTDISDGFLQQVDLKPNTSSRNLIYTPKPGQTGYIQNIRNSTLVGNVVAGPPLVASAQLTGLSAYLIGNIDTTIVGGSAVLSAAQADAAAAALIAIAVAGGALTLAVINGVLNGIVAGTTLTGGGSTGVLTELLSIMAGHEYVIPSGTALSDGAGLFAGRVGAFDDTSYRQLYDADGFLVSNVFGNLSLMKSATFTYGGIAGAAIAVYSATGAIL